MGEAQEARTKQPAHANMGGKSRSEVCWLVGLSVGRLVGGLADEVIGLKGTGPTSSGGSIVPSTSRDRPGVVMD